MKYHPKQQHGLQGKLNQRVCSHKMGHAVEQGFAEQGGDIDRQMNY